MKENKMAKKVLVKKPDCYQCEYRGSVPGDAHSCCRHPENKAILDNPMAKIIAILGSVGRVPPMQYESKLKVTGSPHGIKNNWFNWPLNFDPTWLEECNGFKPKEK